MLSPESLGESIYGKLRSWYLAKLRSRIWNQAGSGAATPRAQIVADRKALEQLILSNKPEDKHPVTALQSAWLSLQTLRLFLVFLLFLVQGPALVVLLVARQHGLVLLAAIAELVVTAAIIVLLDTAVFKRLKRLCSLLLTHTDEQLAKNLDQFCELERLSCSLVNSQMEAVSREQAIADYALDFICALDKDNCFCAISPMTAMFWGYQAQELIGRNFDNFVAAEDVARTTTFLSSVRNSSTTVFFQNRMRRSDGRLMDLQWQMEWSKSEETLFCISRDISDEKSLERMRQEFVSMVGHDLRTPLTSIKCTLELIASNVCGELSEKGQELLAAANADLERLLRLVGELLDLEKMEAGQLPMQLKATTLASVLAQAVSSVSSYAKSKKLVILLDESDFVVRADEERLIQVIINLLSNAIKFSPEAANISLTVSKEADSALIAVSDQGPGVAPELTERIFERFQQGSLEDRKKGSGLGLSICKAIVEAHAGSIGIKTKLGVGSTFWVRIPLAR